MSTFENLKKSNDNLSRLLSEVDKINTPKNDSNNSSQDDRFWRPELDKSGNGYAVIRFLPESEGEELPWVRIWNHGFQGPTGKWYIPMYIIPRIPITYTMTTMLHGPCDGTAYNKWNHNN